MNTTDTVQTTSGTREYLDLWMRFISERLSELGHHDLKTETVSFDEFPGNMDAKDENATWVRFAGPGTGEQAFFLGVNDAQNLLRLLDKRPPGQVGDAEQRLDPQKEVETFFSEIAEKVSLAEWLGSDGKLEVSGSNTPGWERAVLATYQFTSSQSVLLVLQALLSSDFASALQSARQTDKPEGKAFSSVDSSPIRTVTELVRDTRLELLMDVELEVVLRFGQRDMLLRDVFNLTPGTVLELNQQIQDPVELLVGNKVIAWGDVVTVDGNYGLRITGLASRKERLESLRR